MRATLFSAWMVMWPTMSLASLPVVPAPGVSITDDTSDHMHHGELFLPGVEHEVDLTGFTTGVSETWEGLSEHAHDRPMLIQQVSHSPDTVTITGRVFYEDHRTYGQFHRRSDPTYEEGVPDGQRTSDLQWLLAANYMVVDLYELDFVMNEMEFAGCTPVDDLGSATVQPDGSFSFTVSRTDDCAMDMYAEPTFKFRVRTRYCNDDVCFQVGPGRSDYYSLWHEPFTVGDASTYSVGDMVFTNRSNGGEKNDWARAANQFASLVDAIVTLHLEEGIPFRTSTYGGLQVHYPHRSQNGQASDYDLIRMNNNGWPDGGKMMHEYGHIVHRRAWGGDYAGYANDDLYRDWGGSAVMRPFSSMKEGWALFVQRYVSGKCFRPNFDDNHDFTSLRRDEGGIRFTENHHRMLCDWVDDRDDKRSGVTGAGDVFKATLWSLWHNLDETDERIAAYGGNNPEDPGLNVCDMVGYYLEVRKSADEVGQTAHDQYVWWISSLLQNNDISCPDVPRPATLRAYDFDVALAPVAVDDSALDWYGTGTRRVTMEVVIDNNHPFIEAEGGRLAVRDETKGRLLFLGDVQTIRPTRDATYTVEAEVDMVGGVPLPARIVATVVDTAGYDSDGTNDVAEVVLDVHSLRPNLTVSLDADVPSDELPEVLTVTVQVDNDGLTDAELSSGLLHGATRFVLRDTLGDVVDYRVLRGSLVPGASRTFTIDVALSEELRALGVSHLIASIDTLNSVPELSERDNSCTLVLRQMDYVDVPLLDVLSDDPSALVEASMWVEDLQHDIFQDAIRSAYPWWTFQSQVDRAFHQQLQELPVDMIERPWVDFAPSEVSVGLQLDVVPNTREATAAQLAQQWRWLP